jgi:hypothetical protein
MRVVEVMEEIIIARLQPLQEKDGDVSLTVVGYNS